MSGCQCAQALRNWVDDHYKRARTEAPEVKLARYAQALKDIWRVSEDDVYVITHNALFPGQPIPEEDDEEVANAHTNTPTRGGVDVSVNRQDADVLQALQRLNAYVAYQHQAECPTAGSFNTDAICTCEPQSVINRIIADLNRGRNETKPALKEGKSR